jgi:hypothetical protein
MNNEEKKAAMRAAFRAESARLSSPDATAQRFVSWVEQDPLRSLSPISIDDVAAAIKTAGKRKAVESAIAEKMDLFAALLGALTR